MVVCLMRISSRSRKLLGIFNGFLIGFLILLESTEVLLKTDKFLEFFNIGILDWLWNQDSLFLCSNLITSILLIFSVSLLVVVLDVVMSQESDHFNVGSKSYSLPIYILFVSFIFCVLSYTLSLRIFTEFDSKMTKLLMFSYSNYGESRNDRRLVDRIHVEYSCCGVKSIDDFVDLSEIDKSLPTQTKLWSCNEWEYCGVPLSCCKSISCSQKTQLLADGWDTINIAEKWFNRKGCVEKMKSVYLFWNIANHNLTDFIMILVLGLHICSILLTQMLITASATLHRARLDSSQASYAWLLDVGQPDRASLMKKLNPELASSDVGFATGHTDNAEQEDLKGEEVESGKDSQASTNTATTEIESTTLLETQKTEGENTSGTTSTTGVSTGTKTENTDAKLADDAVHSSEKPPALSDNEVLIFDSNTGTTKKVSEKPGGVPKPKRSKKKSNAPKKTLATKRKPSKNSKGGTKTKKSAPKKGATKKPTQKRKPVSKAKRK